MNLLICELISAACLIVLGIQLVIFVLKALLKGRAQRIAYIRNFKRGRCVIVYFTALPLYFIGYLYSGTGIIESFFSSIHRIINLIVLKYEFTAVAQLMADSSIFSLTIYVNFILVGVNAVMFALSLFGQHVSYAIGLVLLNLGKKQRLYIFGINDQNKLIYNSYKNGAKCLIGYADDKQQTAFYVEKIKYVQVSPGQNYTDDVVAKCKRGEVYAVINTQSDDENIKLCRKFILELNKLVKKEQNSAGLLKKLHIYVFGDPLCYAIYSDLVSASYGVIQFVDKYQQIAIDFVDRYPLSAFMTKRHIDEQNAILKNDVKLNVFMLGFGDVNHKVFLTSVANNQFLTLENGEMKLKMVNYHFFDKQGSGYDKNLNHEYYRYADEKDEFDPQQYLPLPQVPANEFYHTVDFASREFYPQLKGLLSGGEESINYVIISYGSDLENIDMAKKLNAKRKEWGLNNTYIFVRSRREYKEIEQSFDEKCFFFGNEKQSVYNFNAIVNDKFNKMAAMRNEVYDIEYEVTHNEDKVNYTEEDFLNIKKQSSVSWYLHKTQTDRLSSIYCCLSLRCKLHMLGLDYCSSDSAEKGLTESEYFNIYAKDDMPNTSFYNVTIDGKAIVKYTTDYKQSKRKNLAMCEHYRWNSFMISQGFVPASINSILSEKIVNKKGVEKYSNGKNISIRTHGNLTTFEGLKQFSKLIAQRDGKSEAEKDVIKYDYQLLDDAYWFITKTGNKIIYKKSYGSK